MRKLSKVQATNLLLTIHNAHKNLHLMPMNNDDQKNHYYKQREIFADDLKDAWKKFECVLHKMSSREIVFLLSLCSTYRPFEPWQILNHISMLNDELTDKITGEIK